MTKIVGRPPKGTPKVGRGTLMIHPDVFTALPQTSAVFWLMIGRHAIAFNALLLHDASHGYYYNGSGASILISHFILNGI